MRLQLSQAPVERSDGPIGWLAIAWRVRSTISTLSSAFEKNVQRPGYFCGVGKGIAAGAFGAGVDDRINRLWECGQNTGDELLFTCHGNYRSNAFMSGLCNGLTSATHHATDDCVLVAQAEQFGYRAGAAAATFIQVAPDGLRAGISVQAMRQEQQHFFRPRANAPPAYPRVVGSNEKAPQPISHSPAYCVKGSQIRFSLASKNP